MSDELRALLSDVNLDALKGVTMQSNEISPEAIANLQETSDRIVTKTQELLQELQLEARDITATQEAGRSGVGETPNFAPKGLQHGYEEGNHVSAVEQLLAAEAKPPPESKQHTPVRSKGQDMDM